MAEETLKIATMTPQQASKIFSAVYNRRITEDQVRQIAQDGNLLRPDGTFSLVRYTAYLAREMGNG